MPELFVNGEGMRGGAVYHNIEGHPFLGAVRTAPKYRFFSVRDEFPGVFPSEDGASIVGELYDVPLAVLEEAFLPDEPKELEFGVIRLDDGRAVMSMVMRAEEIENGEHQDITAFGGWHEYRARAVDGEATSR